MIIEEKTKNTYLCHPKNTATDLFNVNSMVNTFSVESVNSCLNV